MHHSASFSAVLRVHLEDVPGTFGRLAAAIGEAGGLLDAIDLVRVEGGEKVRDVTVLADNAGHMDAIADAAVRVNSSVENIGARRLSTVMERLVEEISFDAPDHQGEVIKIDAGYVKGKIDSLAADRDLSRFVL